MKRNCPEVLVSARICGALSHPNLYLGAAIKIRVGQNKSPHCLKPVSPISISRHKPLFTMSD
jgi:hypothetical protein